MILGINEWEVMAKQPGIEGPRPIPSCRHRHQIEGINFHTTAIHCSHRGSGTSILCTSPTMFLEDVGEKRSTLPPYPCRARRHRTFLRVPRM